MLPVPGGVRGGTRGGAEAGWQVRQCVYWGGRAPAAGVGRVIEGLDSRGSEGGKFVVQ